MAHANVTPEEVLRKILNEVSNEENDNIEDIASLASGDEIDVVLSTSFNFDNPDDVNGADQNVTGNQDNASNTAETTQRRQLTRDRLIHDLESALDEQNYIPLSLPTTKKTFTSFLENPKPPNNLGLQIQWSNVCSSRGRQMQLNIIQDKTGVREEVKDKKSPLQAWMLFFTKAMLNIIVIETNRKIEETMRQLQSMLAADSSSRYGYIRLTIPSEVLALIGIIYMRGLLGQTHQGTNAMFYKIFGNPVFSATMSRNRFNILIAHMSFDDHTWRSTRWQHDRFAFGMPHNFSGKKHII